MKSKTLLAAAFSFLFAAQTHAGLIVTLVPSNPGPYDLANPASLTFNVDVMLRLDAYGPTGLRERTVRFDVADSDPMIGVAGALTHPNTQTYGDLYFWDFSSLESYCTDDPLLCGEGQVIDDSFDDDGLVQIDFVGLTHSGPPRQLVILQSISRRVGRLEIMLPTVPGEYVLDVLNADDTDPYRGAILSFGLNAESVVTWSAPDGTITGGRHVFTVVPEPGTIVLLLLGMACLTTRRSGQALNRQDQCAGIQQ